MNKVLYHCGVFRDGSGTDGVLSNAIALSLYSRLQGKIQVSTSALILDPDAVLSRSGNLISVCWSRTFVFCTKVTTNLGPAPSNPTFAAIFVVFFVVTLMDVLLYADDALHHVDSKRRNIREQLREVLRLERLLHFLLADTSSDSLKLSLVYWKVFVLHLDDVRRPVFARTDLKSIFGTVCSISKQFWARRTCLRQRRAREKLIVLGSLRFCWL